MYPKSERVYRSILNRIMSGELSAGESVPERPIAVELGVGRTPVREAVLRLEQEGLVEVCPPRGRVVRLWSPADVRARYEIRFALESIAVEWAARMPALDIHRRVMTLCDKMEALARNWREGESGEEAVDLDIRFHSTLVETSGNNEIKRAAGLFHLAGTIFMTSEEFALAGMASTNRDHRRIAECLLKQDVPGAQAVLKTHLKSAAEGTALWIEKRIVEGVYAVV